MLWAIVCVPRKMILLNVGKVYAKRDKKSKLGNMDEFDNSDDKLLIVM